jgi:DNA repair protein RecO
LEEEADHPELFQLTLQTLHTMNQHPEHHALLRELFLLKSLSILGVLSSFRTCSQCREPLPLQTAYFDENHLTVHCEPCLNQATPGREIFLPQELPLASLKLLHSIGKNSFEQLLKIKLETAHHELLWSMGRRFLRQALNTPLNSEAFLTLA